MTRLTTTYRNGLRRTVLASALSLALLAAFGAGALAGELAVGARYDLGDNQAMSSRLSALAVAQESRSTVFRCGCCCVPTGMWKATFPSSSRR